MALPMVTQLPLGGGAPTGLRAGAELELCDCEKATGSPDGLSCGKEGWFISSFEREGSWVRALSVLCSPSSRLDGAA